ncbi:MAG: hypothetical protein HMLKMBBP_02504 [Planctomycetes bacterium]|nr:hypothetical protein [Planctomycetota bacterium]
MARTAHPPTHPSQNVRPVALNHVHLTAEDPEAEIAFLCNVLGFRRDKSHRSFVWLGNMQLAVTKGEPIRNERFHLGFRMDSAAAVDELCAALAKHGIAATEAVETGGYFSRSFQDPAGYWFEVFADGGIPALGSID